MLMETNIARSPLKSSSINDCLEYFATTVPQKIAYVFVDKAGKEKKLTFSELFQNTQKLSVFLLQMLKQGDRALLIYDNEEEFVVAFWACLFSGVIAIPVPPVDNVRIKHVLPRLRAIVSDSEAKAILTTAETKTMLEVANVDFPDCIGTENCFNKVFSIQHKFRFKPSDVAYLQYTSGSTSSPKGVVITHQNIISNCETLKLMWQMDNSSISCSWLPYFHDYGLVYSVVLPVYSGIKTIVIPPSYFIRNAIRWLELISKYKVTHSGGPNFGYDLCLRHYRGKEALKLDLSSWGVAHNGAEPIRLDTLKQFSETFGPFGFKFNNFYPSYGMAEATLMISTKVDPEPKIIQANKMKYSQGIIKKTNGSDSQTIVGCGKAARDFVIRIVNPDKMSLCLPNVIGEVWVQDESVAKGYWNNPQATKETFEAYTSDTNEGPFLRTGDLGFLDEDGELYITSRLKDLIIIRGRNIYPHDIELVVEQTHKAIKQHGVVAFSIEVDTEEKLVVVAEVDKKYTKDIELEVLANRVQEHLTEQFEVDCYDIVFTRSGSIPKTSSGKIQHQLSKTMYQEQQFQVWFSKQQTKHTQERTMPRLTDIWEKTIARAWSELLGMPISSLTSDSHFFHIGGDSLRSIELAFKLSELTGIEINADFVFEYPTLEGQSQKCKTILNSPKAFDASDIAFTHLYKPSEHQDKETSLLPLQQSFFINRSFGDTGCYAFADISLTGGITADSVKTALETLINRHPALQLSFHSTEKGPVQKYESTTEAVPIFFDDISSLKAEEQEEKIAEFSRKLVETTFNGNHSLLCVFHLIKFSEGVYRLLLNADHLVVDGFSLGLLLEDLYAILTAQAKEKNISDFPQTTLGFLNVVEDRMTESDQEKKKRDVAYWKSYLESWEPFPELPLATSIFEPTQNTFKSVDTPLSKTLLEDLKGIAKSHNVTLFSLLFGTFFKLLQKWTHSETLFVNTPVLNRYHRNTDIQKIIGCLTDILPVKGDRLSTMSVVDIAKCIHHDISGLHTYNSVSGVELARLKLKESQQIQALSPIIFSSALLNIKHHQNDVVSQVLNGIRTGAPQTWLDVVVLDTGEQLVFSWNYRVVMFDSSFIERLSHGYLSLLESVVHETDFTILMPEDLDAYKTLNRTSVNLGNPQLLHQRISEQCVKTPDAVAVTFSEKELTYRELNESSDKVAVYLQEKGIQVGDFVPVIMDRSDVFIVAILGVLKAGGAYVPIDPDYPLDRQREIFDQSRASFAILSKKMSSESFDKASSVFIEDILTRKPNKSVRTGVDLDSPAYMIFTSGSTGKPKGVVISHRAIDNRLCWMQAQFSIDSDDVIAQRTSQSFDVSVWELFWPLQYGARVHVIPVEEVKDPQKLLGHFVVEKITVAHFVPSLFQAFVSSLESLIKYRDTSLSLKWIVTSGEALSISGVQKWQHLFPDIPIANLYGPTEASIDVTYHLITNPLSQQENDIPIGKPVANTSIYIVDTNHELCPVGVKGELVISGIQLSSGYFGKEELSARSFVTIPDPITGKPTRMYKTGDIAFLSHNGDVYFFGRSDHQVKIRGHRIECGEIESVIAQWPGGIDQVFVTSARLNGAMNHSLVAYLTYKKADYSHDSAIISSDNIILEPKKRSEFQLAEHNLRKDIHDVVIELPKETTINDSLLVRKSVRYFKEDPISLLLLSQYLSCLKQYTPNHLPKYAYPSAGSLYPVQTYVYVKRDRVAGLDKGLYYYHPKQHELQLISTESISKDVHVSYNQPYFESSAFSLFLIGNLDAIEPLYGNISRDFCLLEAGYMGQLLMSEAKEYQLGICPIGALDFHQIVDLFKTTSNSFLCHSFVCGIPDERRLNDQNKVVSDDLKTFLQAKLPDYMVPNFFIELNEFPVTSNGKLNRKALPNPKDYINHADSDYKEPGNETERALSELWAEVIGIKRLGITDHFFEIGGDSIRLVELSVRMSKLLNQDVSVSELLYNPTIKGFLEKTKLDTVDLNKEAHLEEAIQPIPNSPTKSVSHVMLTGATGFLGAFLLRELLDLDDIQSVTCLVRAKNNQEALERIKRNLDNYELSVSVNRTRLKVIACDLSKPHLGLEQKKYHSLVSSIDTVYHCAAQVNFIADYQGLKASNVESTKELIKFCCSGQNKHLHYVSTIAIYDGINAPTINETCVIKNGEKVVGGYPQSKWVSEQLIKQINSRGLPTTIYRPPMIFGDQVNGHANNHDFLVNLIRGCIEIGKVPDLDIDLDVVPVDFVSKAIVGFSFNNQASGVILNLNSPIKLPLQKLFALIKNEFGLDLTYVPFSDWIASLQHKSEHSLSTVMPFIMNKINGKETVLERYQRSIRPCFDSRETFNELKRVGVESPDMGKKWLVKCFRKIVFETKFQEKIVDVGDGHGS